MDLPQRKSIRLKNYDYSTNGAYFITICTKNRICILGNVIDGKICLNEHGKTAYDQMVKTMEKRPYVLIDKFVIMPNHIHMLISIYNADTARRVPTVEQFGEPTKNSIPTIIRSFKSAVTNEIRKNVGTRRAVSDPAISDRIPDVYDVWQGRYHDHIIRNESEYKMIAEYIDHNPENWAEDRFYMP